MARTQEQLEAAHQLQSIASGLRVEFDAEGWPVIRGQRGQIEYHDGKDLAVYTDRPKMFRQLRDAVSLQRRLVDFPGQGLRYRHREPVNRYRSPQAGRPPHPPPLLRHPPA